MNEATTVVEAIVSLNVGGVLYTTRLNTLKSVPDSYFCKMFSDEKYVEKDSEGRVFIDRDGEIFKYILQYLRDGANTFLPDEPTVRARLRAEADFFLLPELSALIDRVVTLRFHCEQELRDLKDKRQWSEVKISLVQLKSEPYGYFWELANNIIQNTIKYDERAVMDEGIYYIKVEKEIGRAISFRFHNAAARICNFLKYGICAMPFDNTAYATEYPEIRHVAKSFNARGALACWIEQQDKRALCSALNRISGNICDVREDVSDIKSLLNDLKLPNSAGEEEE